MAHRKGYITRQAKRLTDGEINRRRFVMSALSAGVTMPTALSLASKAEASVPKAGGVLRIATADGHFLRNQIAPHATGAFGRLLPFTYGNALTEVLPDGSLVGELAEDFGTLDAGRTWVFDLRRDVMFHDGGPFTSADVLATLARHGAVRLPGACFRAEGAYRVIATLTEPDAAFARRLSDPSLVIQPASLEGWAGTGPYRLDRVTEDGRAIFQRNHHYWKPGRAHVDQVELIPLPHMSSRQTAIMAGDVDYADGIDPRALAFLRHAPNVEVLEIAAGRHIALSPDRVSCAKSAALLDELRHRLPYRALLDQVLLGHGKMGAVGNPSAPAGTPTKALRIAVRDDGVPRTGEAARLIADHLSKGGTPVELVSPDADAAHLSIGWRRCDPAAENPDENSVVALWANDIVAHSSKLAHEAKIATNLENDGARLAERWWFA